MTRQEFDDLVKRIEQCYAGQPAALERSTSAWVVVGLAGILSYLALLFLLGFVAFALGIVLEFQVGIWLLVGGVLMILFAISQAVVFLAVDPTPPEGRGLKPGEAPALGEMLDSLRRELQCRPFDDVRISMNFNAGIRDIPRLGLLGWPRTILELGLPLMSVLTPEELRAVLAHELAHHSARHARSGSRIYRLHATWGNVFHRMQRPTTSSFGRRIRWVAARFVDWYWPRLHARAMVLSRAQEYHADRVAAGVAGGSTLVSALWRMQCIAPWLAERFWIEVFQEADRMPEPPTDVLERMRSARERPPAADDASRWMERALTRTTGNDETHPAFRERAAALGMSADDMRKGGFPAPVRPSAAEALLGADLAVLEPEVAGHWRRGVLGGWRERHRRATAEAGRRERLAEAAADPSIDLTLMTWKAARETLELRGPAAAEPLLRAVLERAPGHAGARVLLGHHLLNLGDPEGRSLLEQVVGQADESWMRPACDILEEHFRLTGQADQLREIRTRLDRHEKEIAAAQRERATLKASDFLLPHELTDVDLEPLLRALGGPSGLRRRLAGPQGAALLPAAPPVLAVRPSQVGEMVAEPARSRPRAGPSALADDRAARPGAGGGPIRVLPRTGRPDHGVPGRRGLPVGPGGGAELGNRHGSLITGGSSG